MTIVRSLPTHQTPCNVRALNITSSIYSSLGLKVNISKTQIIVQHSTHHSEVPIFNIDGQELTIVPHFTYLGSVLSPTCNIDHDIQARVGAASAAFGRLKTRVFLNRNLTVSTKAAVYKAVCLSTLLYGSEAWTPYQRHVRILERFHIRCLQRILGLTWEDRVPYVDIYDRTQTPSIQVFLAQHHLRWVGHVIRMPAHRLPRQILYGQPQEGFRSPVGSGNATRTTLKPS